MSRQVVSAAVILNSDHQVVGKILIRFVGEVWNHEISVGITDEEKLDYSAIRRGDSYSNPATLINVFNKAGYRCFTHYNEEMELSEAGKYNGFRSVVAVKKGNKKYAVHFAI